MVIANQPFPDEDVIATLTDIAYRALLRHGLRRSFVDVELDLWREIRARYERDAARADAALTVEVR